MEWNQRAEMFAFSKRLQENMSEEMLGIVFTDVSYMEKEHKKREELGMSVVDPVLQSNERLAEKGRKVMSPFIKQYLRFFLPKLPEEGIAALHDFLLETENVADMSSAMGTSDIILKDSVYPPEDNQLSNCLLAFIGGLSEEQGEKKAQNFIIDFIMSFLQDKQIFEIWDLEDARATLNVILSNQGLPAFEPRLIRETGRNTIEPCFAVGLFVNKKMISWSAAETVKEAEEMAAFEALKTFFEIRPSHYIFKYGVEAYDLDYASFTKENMAVKGWTSIDVKQSVVDRLSG